MKNQLNAMDCKEAEKSIPLYVGNDLSDPRTCMRLKKHLAECPACSNQFQQYRKAMEDLKRFSSGDVPEEMGDEFQEDLQDRLASIPDLSERSTDVSDPSTTGMSRGMPTQVLRAAMLLVCLGVGVFAVVLFLNRTNETEEHLSSTQSKAPVNESDRKDASPASDRPASPASDGDQFVRNRRNDTRPVPLTEYRTSPREGRSYLLDQGEASIQQNTSKPKQKRQLVGF